MPGELRRQLGLLLQRLPPSVVVDVLLGNEVVDDGHAVGVAHEGGHLRRRAPDGVDDVGPGAGLEENAADEGLAGQGGEVQGAVLVLMAAAVHVRALRGWRKQKKSNLATYCCW